MNIIVAIMLFIMGLFFLVLGITFTKMSTSAYNEYRHLQLNPEDDIEGNVATTVYRDITGKLQVRKSICRRKLQKLLKGVWE